MSRLVGVSGGGLRAFARIASDCSLNPEFASPCPVVR